MRIAFITDAIRKDITGVGVYSRSIIKSFLKFQPKFNYSFIDYKVTIFNKHRIFLIKNEGIFSKISLWYCYIALKLFKDDYDFIFNCTGTPHIIPFRQKEILIFHDSHAVLYPEFTSKKTHIYNILLLKWTLRNAYKIIVNSDQTKLELMTYFHIPEKKIMKTYIPSQNVGLTKFSRFLRYKPYLLNINTIDSRKNILNIIKAFEYLKEVFKSKQKLLIVGKQGFGYKRIIDYINHASYKKDIILTGYVKEDEKEYLLKNADMLIYIPFYEGLGLPILEAAHSKIPFVASKIPSATEILKNTKVFDPENYIDIAARINQINKMLKFKKKMVNRNYSLIKKYYGMKTVKKKCEEIITFISTPSNR